MEKSTFIAIAALVVALWLGAMAVLFAGSARGAGDGAFPDSGVAPGGGQAGGGSSDSGGSGDISGAAQEIYLKALRTGVYDKQELVVKKGVPVRLHFTADRDIGCGRSLFVKGLNLSAVSRNGEEQVVSFTPEKEGVFEYSCAMWMWKPGKIVVKA